MNKLVFVQTLKYIQPEPVHVLHSNVIVINTQEPEINTSYNKELNKDMRNGERNRACVRETRTYRCLDCGREWRENILSPILVEDSVSGNINQYYRNLQKCNILK